MTIDEALNSLSSEDRALLCCASRRVNPAATDASPNGLDATRLLQSAQRHRLVPLLPALPIASDSREEIESESKLCVARSLQLTAALLMLWPKLEALNVAVVPVKGPALLSELYGGELQREFDDIDLLIRPGDLPAIHSVMIESGYVPLFDLSVSQWSRFADSFDEIPYQHADTGVCVDLQWRVVGEQYSFSPDTAAYFSRVGTVTISGRSFPALHPDDLLEFLLLHGSKHGWARLCWLMDLGVALSRRSENFVSEWTRSKTGDIRMKSTAVLLLTKLLNLPVSESLSEFLESVEESQVIAGQIITGMFSASNDAKPLANYDLFPSLMTQTRDRKRFRYEVTAKPTPWEWQLVPLPGAMTPLYHVLRPLRVAARRLTGRSRPT